MDDWFTGRLRWFYSLLGSACMGWWCVFPHMLARGFIKMLLDIRHEVEKILNICEMNGKPCVIRVIEPFSNWALFPIVNHRAIHWKRLINVFQLDRFTRNINIPLTRKVYWSSCAGHFYLRIFILQWAHPIVGCMRPFKIVIMNELRDFLFNSVFIHSRSVT